MDLISREAVDNAMYDYCHSCDVNESQMENYFCDLPSAFEGMTYGEVLTAIFPNFTFQKAWDEVSARHCMIMWTGENLICDFPLDFWNSPYKGVSE